MFYVIGNKSLSIHDLHGEVDHVRFSHFLGLCLSIHDLHGEVDGAHTTTVIAIASLSIHDLHGEVDFCACTVPKSCEIFQFTTSMGRSTRTRRISRRSERPFNSRPPWGGRRMKLLMTMRQKNTFNSRPPWGGRLPIFESIFRKIIFQFTTSMGRSTRDGSSFSLLHPDFQFTTSMGRSTAIFNNNLFISKIIIRQYYYFLPFYLSLRFSFYF